MIISVRENRDNNGCGRKQSCGIDCHSINTFYSKAFVTSKLRFDSSRAHQ